MAKRRPNQREKQMIREFVDFSNDEIADVKKYLASTLEMQFQGYELEELQNIDDSELQKALVGLKDFLNFPTKIKSSAITELLKKRLMAIITR